MEKDIKHDSQQIELIGVAALEAELVKQGFELARPVRDRGIDLIAYSDDASQPFKATPIQIKASTGQSFGVYRKYEKFQGLVFVYIWNVLETPRFFIVPYDDAVNILPEKSKKTHSWTRTDGQGGSYTWSNIPQHIIPSIKAYENRWDLI